MNITVVAVVLLEENSHKGTYSFSSLSQLCIILSSICLFPTSGLLANPFIFFFYDITNFFLPIHFKSKTSLLYFAYFCFRVVFLPLYSKDLPEILFLSLCLGCGNPHSQVILTSSFYFPMKFRLRVCNSTSS